MSQASIISDMMGLGLSGALATYIATYVSPASQDAFNTNTATVGATATAAQITGGDSMVTLALTGTLGGAAALTLPTAAAAFAAVPSAVIGLAYRLRIINESSGAFTWTVTTNTGWTLTGTMTVAQNTWREFNVLFTSATAATLQNIGTGTFS